MKRLYPVVTILILLILCLAVCASCGGKQATQAETGREEIYQVSTLGALMAGVYDGAVTYSELGEHGDMGLGTFSGLDGEMVGLDGKFYKVEMSGEVVEAEGSWETPYAVVTFFDSDIEKPLNDIGSFEELSEAVGGMLETENAFYAVLVDGDFDYLKIRTVPKEEPPFPTLPETLEKQAVFEHEDIEGTMVGFFAPDYVGELDAHGFHLHFISADRKAGGHVLECEFKEAALSLDESGELYLVLPENENFRNSNLSPQ